MENKTKSFLSVIIPVYNVERYLQQWLDNVLEQISKEDEMYNLQNVGAATYIFVL